MKLFLKSPFLLVGLLLAACHAEKRPAPTPTNTPETFISLQDMPPLSLTAGSEQEAILHFKIADGYHILSDDGEDTSLELTKLAIAGNDCIHLGDPKFPSPERYELTGADYYLSIFEGMLPIKIPVRAVLGAKPQTHQLNGTLTYQVCNPQKCFFPRELAFELVVEVL